jgi:hypothetical protein
LDADGTAGLYLLETRGRRKDHVRLEGARFVIPEGNEFAQSAEECNGKIVECRYLKDEDAWELMRFRVDKGTANAYFVYEKVSAQSRECAVVTREISYSRLFGHTQLCAAYLFSSGPEKYQRQHHGR